MCLGHFCPTDFLHHEDTLSILRYLSGGERWKDLPFTLYISEISLSLVTNSLQFPMV